MKLAVSGKGGVGKTTLAAALIQLLAQRGQQVLALDADPNANLAGALGFPEDVIKTIVPIVNQNKLIEERTGAKVKQYGQVFKLNPEVSDVVEKYGTVYNSIALITLGGLDKGGGGCACPENTFIRTLITDMILFKNQNLVIDLEAGVEHLGRATAQGVDTMILVLEPSDRSVNVGLRVIQMAAEINITNIKIVANKVNNQADEAFIKKAFPNIEILGIIPYSEEIRVADRNKKSVLDGLSPDLLHIFTNILEKLTITTK